MGQVLPFNGFYTESSKKNSARECVNYAPIPHDSGSLSEYTLKSTMGITGPVDTFSTTITDVGPILSDVVSWNSRSAGSTGATVFATGQFGVLIASSGSAVNLIQIPGPLNSQIDTRFALGGDYLVIVPRIQSTQSRIQVYDGSSDPIVSVDVTATLPGNLNLADAAYFGNRYLLMSEAGSFGDNKGRVYYSDINDPTVYDPGGFFSSFEQYSVNTGMHVLSDRLYLFSEESFSVWIVSPDVNQPFRPQRGSAGDIGLVDPMGKCEVSGTLYFIGRSEQSIGFFAMSGAGISKVSTPAIDTAINGSDAFGVIRCFSFSDDGRTYVAFSILNSTFCYDISSGEYHKRSTNGGRWEIIGSGNSLSSTQGERNNQVLFGGKVTNNGSNSFTVDTGSEDQSIGTELGGQVSRFCITSPFNSDGVTNRVSQLVFRTDIDYTTFNPGLEHPQLKLEVSKDFANTFEAPEFQEFERLGETDKLLTFRNIGVFRQAFVLRISTNIPYSHHILKMLAKIKKGFREL